MIRIAFTAIGVHHSFRDKPRLVKLIRRLSRDHGARQGSLAFVLMTDDALLSINERFLNKTYFTDVITFGGDQGPGLNGEVLISYHRTKENARAFSVSHQVELRRVVLHGVLHLLGYNDGTPEERLRMTRAEDFYLARF
jgi:probable rRNA maturation factor